MGIDQKQSKDVSLEEKPPKSLKGFKKLPPEVLKSSNIFRNMGPKDEKE
jgi:hypothetical protein